MNEIESNLKNRDDAKVPEMNDVEFYEIPAHVTSWDEYFLAIATVASIKSKDPNCPVGAVIVSPDHMVVSTGFNGMARGVHDDERILHDKTEKLRSVCHAEYNAILNAARIGACPLQGTTIYVNKFPCFDCCKAIVQAGIKRICTLDDGYWKNDPVDTDHSRKRNILREAHIEVYAPNHPEFMAPKPILLKQAKKPVGRVSSEDVIIKPRQVS